MKKIKIALLPRIILAIVLGVLLGMVLPDGVQRLFATFNGLFSQLLSFFVPLIIVGLIVPAIADIGRGAGKMLGLTVLLSYGLTTFAGFLSLSTGYALFPSMIDVGSGMQLQSQSASLEPYFTMNIPPMFDVMSALVFAFVLGIGIAYLGAQTIHQVAIDFRRIINAAISTVIIPLLPLYIMGIFMDMTHTGQVAMVLGVFMKIIVVIFALHILLLVLDYVVAGAVVHRSPYKLLVNMLPAYFTALGTQSSAATIPVTLKQVEKNGVRNSVAAFVVPLCATINMSGSELKIVACSLALMMVQGMDIQLSTMVGFVLILGVMMVAGPSVPGGAIMAALGVLHSVLGFDEGQQALMIALYIAMDSFGTACNVTGDGAIALIVDRVFYGRKPAADEAGKPVQSA